MDERVIEMSRKQAQKLLQQYQAAEAAGKVSVPGTIQALKDALEDGYDKRTGAEKHGRVSVKIPVAEGDRIV